MNKRFFDLAISLFSIFANMKTFGNIVWLIFGGIATAVLYYVAGLLACITVIGIPLGMAHFKIAFAAVFPFGREIRKTE